MAEHLWLVTYGVGEDLEEREVAADFFEEVGSFVTFLDEPNKATGEGGAVFAVLADAVVSVERVTRPHPAIHEVLEEGGA